MPQAWLDYVVPVAVELVSLDVQRTEFLGRDLLAGWIAATIEPRADDETASVGGVADQVDDGLVGPQGTTAPVDRDEREQPVLDLVPLAGARRKVADVDREVEFIGELLKLGLPHARAVAVAAAGIGGDEDLAGAGIARLA